MTFWNIVLEDIKNHNLLQIKNHEKVTITEECEKILTTHNIEKEDYSSNTFENALHNIYANNLEKELAFFVYDNFLVDDEDGEPIEDIWWL